MNNWRLLLLAVVVVVQPIGSFTESNLIDGRECCERSENARLYGYRKIEEHRSLDGDREDSRTTNERRLNSQDRNLERQYETQRPMLTRPEGSLERSERRISPELSRSTQYRSVRDQERRHRETRGDQKRNRDESRSSVVQFERNSIESRNRDTFDSARTFLSRNARDTRTESESRNFLSRLPIRTSRSVQERDMSPNRQSSTILRQERENIVRSETRRDSRLSASQLDQNKERRVLDRRTSEDNSEYRSSARVDDEGRAVRALKRRVETVRNNRNSRVIRVELRRQQFTALSDRLSAVRRDSERISRIIRERMETRNNEKFNDRRQQRDESRRLINTVRGMNTAEMPLGSQQTGTPRNLDKSSNDGQVERRSLSMDILSILRESRSRSERNEDEERNARTSNARVHSVQKLDKRSRTDTRESIDERRLFEDQENADRRRESRMVVVRREVSQFSDEKRQRDSQLSRHRTMSSLRSVRENVHRQESRRNSRKSLGEHYTLQRDSSRLSRDRTSSMLREKREGRDTTVQTEDRTSRRIVSPSRTEMNTRSLLDSNSRQEIGDNNRSDLRRQVLERSMDGANHVTRSSEERRHDIRGTSKASRSNIASKINKGTRNSVMDEHRQTKNHNRIVQQRVSRNVATPQGLADDTRRSLRTETIRPELVVRNRDDIRENERREMQRDDSQSSRIILNRRSGERLFAEHRQENRGSSKNSRDIRLVKNLGGVESESVRAERNEENRFSTRDLKNFRGAESVVRSERVLAERRQEIREATRYSRNVRDETRKQGERVLAEREQEKRDLRNVREEIRMDGSLDSRRQRESTKDFRVRSFELGSRDNQRLAERFRDSVARNEIATRNNENLARFVRNMKTANVRRESYDTRSNNLEKDKMYRITEELERDVSNDANRVESRLMGRNMDALNFRNDLEKTEESIFNNWQMIFYTLQGVYLCGLLVQMLTENTYKTKKRTINWWIFPKNLVKMD